MTREALKTKRRGALIPTNQATKATAAKKPVKQVQTPLPVTQKSIPLPSTEVVSEDK
jgi:hypothetical protein